jgi:hypothetical protein
LNALQTEAALMADGAQKSQVEEAIQAALQPSPAGNIVYYRMD